MVDKVVSEDRELSGHKQGHKYRQSIYILKICTVLKKNLHCIESTTIFYSWCEICFKITKTAFSYLFIGDWNCAWKC